MKNKLVIRLILVAVFLVVIILLAIALKKQTGLVEKPVAPVESTVSEMKPEMEGELISYAPIPIDFATLKETENNDIYSWIRILDTPVDYPILRNEAEDDYYLERTVDGKNGLPGSLYTQASYNRPDFSDRVTVIYGHNMRDKSYFGSLDEYSSEEYRKEHNLIYIYTQDKVLTYELAFAVTYNNSHILYKYDCNNDQAGYEEFLNSLKTDTVSPKWITDAFELTVQDQLLILSTCNNNDAQRYLVGAKLISAEDGQYVPSEQTMTSEDE